MSIHYTNLFLMNVQVTFNLWHPRTILWRALSSRTRMCVWLKTGLLFLLMLNTTSNEGLKTGRKAGKTKWLLAGNTASSPGCALGQFLVSFSNSFPQLRVGNFQKIKGGKGMGAKTPKAQSLPLYSCCPNQEPHHLTPEHCQDTGRTQAEALEWYWALPVHRPKKLVWDRRRFSTDVMHILTDWNFKISVICIYLTVTSYFLWKKFISFTKGETFEEPSREQGHWAQYCNLVNFFTK